MRKVLGPLGPGDSKVECTCSRLGRIWEVEPSACLFPNVTVASWIFKAQGITLKLPHTPQAVERNGLEKGALWKPDGPRVSPPQPSHDILSHVLLKIQEQPWYTFLTKPWITKFEVQHMMEKPNRSKNGTASVQEARGRRAEFTPHRSVRLQSHKRS